MRIHSWVTSTLSSPRRVVTTSPSAPTQSPTSRLLEHGRRLGHEPVVLEEQLHVAALVVEGGEAQEALGPQRRQASGDADGLAGVGVRSEVGVGGVELPGRGGAVERVGVDVDAGGGERVDLGQSLGPLGGVAVPRRGVGGVTGAGRRSVRAVVDRALLVLAVPSHANAPEVSTWLPEAGTVVVARR